MKYFPLRKLPIWVILTNQGYLVVNMTLNFYKPYKEKVYWSGSIFPSAFLSAEAIAACYMIGEKACIHRRNF